jgi:hypothetical protein
MVTKSIEATPRELELPIRLSIVKGNIYRQRTIESTNFRNTGDNKNNKAKPMGNATLQEKSHSLTKAAEKPRLTTVTVADTQPVIVADISKQ